MPDRTPRGVPLPHLRAWRERAALAQAELAEAAGVSRPTVARAETGHHVVAWPNIRKLAAALGVTADQLVTTAPRQEGRP